MQRQPSGDQKEAKAQEYKRAYEQVTELILSYQGHLVREFFESLSEIEENSVPYKQIYSYQQIPTDRSLQIARRLYEFNSKDCFAESEQECKDRKHDARKIVVVTEWDEYSLERWDACVTMKREDWADEDAIVRYAISHLGMGIAVPSQEEAEAKYPNTYAAITALAQSDRPYTQYRQDILDKLDRINQLVIYLNNAENSQNPPSYEERLRTLQRLLSEMSKALAKHRNNPGLDAFFSACSIIFTSVLIPFRLIYSKCRYGEYWATFFDTEGQLMYKQSRTIMTEAGVPAPEMKSALG